MTVSSSSRRGFLGITPGIGGYVPKPVPDERSDQAVYLNDELLIISGWINSIIEGGAFPPHIDVPKRVKDSMTIYYADAVEGTEIDSAGLWIYKSPRDENNVIIPDTPGRWYQFVDDPLIFGPEFISGIRKVKVFSSDEQIIKNAWGTVAEFNFIKYKNARNAVLHPIIVRNTNASSATDFRVLLNDVVYKDFIPFKARDNFTTPIVSVLIPAETPANVKVQFRENSVADSFIEEGTTIMML